ncbi:hypothetical protein BCR42DRAFT_193494 [Absidia repens]|uniref:Uncharacterized protein n=1 Tax=Absidia repens TaxID=90262 RepID=A0A1X2ISF1_9FUNG|nr:hypothetical protein BCR42DRAFT_193494 [Absidia repens]
MPKYNKGTKGSSKPYSRSESRSSISKSTTGADSKKKKPITKSEKVKNADITNQLDNLMDDLSSQLTKPKREKKGSSKDKSLNQKQLEEEQQRYEQTQNDMDDALGLLQNL